MSSADTVNVRLASASDVEMLAPLFDAYRSFYGKPRDVPLALAFLLERFALDESVVLLALREHDSALGFAQLYRSFSSVSAARTMLLNDLYVVPAARRSGVASQLLVAAANHARQAGAIRLTLSTAVDNLTAQSLYETHGWERESSFVEYALELAPAASG